MVKTAPYSPPPKISHELEFCAGTGRAASPVPVVFVRWWLNRSRSSIKLSFWFGLRAFLFRHGLCEIEQTPQTGRQAGAIRDDSPGTAQLVGFGKERKQPAIPVSEIRGIEEHTLRRGLGVERADHFGGGWQILVQMPASGEVVSRSW